MQAQSIVELGVGDGVRAERMLQGAAKYAQGEIRYMGVDLFEARPDSDTGLSLKQAYRKLKTLDAQVQLTPGDPFIALSRIANNLAGAELLIIAADQNDAALERAWTFVPRMLHERSLVLWQRPGDGDKFSVVERDEIERLAGGTKNRQAA